MGSSSRWNTFVAAPHRVMFLAGSVQLIATLLWWVVDLAARQTGAFPLQTTVPSIWAHGWSMLFGLFPFFIFGFLMTTYPRWMNGPAVEASAYKGAFLAMAGGVVAFYVGLYVSALLLMVGVVLHTLGFAWGWAALLRVYRAVGSRRDRRYETQLNVALGLGLLAEVAYLGWLASGQPLLLVAALRGALWLYLLPVLVLVAHRMIPFFSGSVLQDYVNVQPAWSFPVLWCAVTLHFALEILGAYRWLFLADLPLLALALHHTLHWGLVRSLSNRLLGSLHLAFLFLSVALALYVIQSLWLLVTGEFILGRGPMHAAAIGFIGGMVMAMVTRVSRGHSGRPLEMDRRDWYAFMGMLAAAVVRVVADLGLAAWSPVSLQLAAGLLWLAAVVPFVIRYLPIYLRPRLDGKPG